MFLRRALVLLAASACAVWTFSCASPGASGAGGAAVPIPAPSAGASASGPEGAPPVPAAHYAALFQPGATWTYEVKTRSQAPDDPERTGDGVVAGSARVVCKVEEVHPVVGGLASRIACDDSLGYQDSVTAEGVWIATARGLWHAAEMPAADGAPSLPEDQMVLSSHPTPDKQETGSESSGSSRTLSKEGDAWCKVVSLWGGDESWSSVCIGPGGVVSGESGTAGGSVHEVSFTLVKP